MYNYYTFHSRIYETICSPAQNHSVHVEYVSYIYIYSNRKCTPKTTFLLAPLVVSSNKSPLFFSHWHYFQYTFGVWCACDMSMRHLKLCRIRGKIQANWNATNCTCRNHLGDAANTLISIYKHTFTRTFYFFFVFVDDNFRARWRLTHCALLLHINLYISVHTTTHSRQALDFHAGVFYFISASLVGRGFSLLTGCFRCSSIDLDGIHSFWMFECVWLFAYFKKCMFFVANRLCVLLFDFSLYFRLMCLLGSTIFFIYTFHVSLLLSADALLLSTFSLFLSLSFPLPLSLFLSIFFF